MKKLLLIECDDAEYKAISMLLKDIGYCQGTIARCCKLCEIALINAEEIEIVLTALTLPDSDCDKTFEEVKNKFLYVPIIVIAGDDEKEAASNKMQKGAQDYLIKGAYDSATLEKSIRDAIERNKILNKFLVQELNLSAILNNTKDIIWSVDKKHNVISANDAFWERIYKISGKRKNEILENDFDAGLFKTWSDYYDKALNGEAYKIIWSEISNESKIYEQVDFNPIHDKEKNIIGISCYSRDITEQYVHQHMVEKQNNQLKKIAWVHSHEVRSPVASILGFVNLFNPDNPADTINTEIIEQLKIAASKLDTITKKINSYTNMSD